MSCHPIDSGRQACGRTSRGHTGFLIHLPSAVLALIFLARRIQPFLSLVDREVEFCVLTNYSFSTNFYNERSELLLEDYCAYSPSHLFWRQRSFRRAIASTVHAAAVGSA